MKVTNIKNETCQTKHPIKKKKKESMQKNVIPLSFLHVKIQKFSQGVTLLLNIKSSFCNYFCKIIMLCLPPEFFSFIP